MISLLEIAQNMNEADDDRYVSIGYGRYKEKGKEDDDNADVYVKTDSGKYVKSSDQKSDDDGGKPEEPKGKSLGKGDFERDFDDTAGDPDDSWDDEEGRAKPTGKTDADTDDDEPKGEPKGKLTSKGKKIQKSKEEFDDIVDDANEPDDIGMWLDDNRYSLSGDGNPTKTYRAFRNLEDAFTDALTGDDDDDWDVYDKQLEDIKNSISKRLDTMIDLHTEKPESDKQKVTEKPGETKQITAAGGNGVLLSKATVGHISAHNEPGEGSVFSDAMGEDEIIKAVSEIPEDFFTTGDERGPGGIHTIETDHNVGYNLVEKAKDIERKYPNAKKIMVNKQAGYDVEKGKPIMKPVPAYIIDNDIEEFGTKQMSVIARPSNPDRMDQELQDDPEVKDNMENKKSFSVLTAFPGDPDVPPAQNWEESGHAIIIPNGGKGADKTNWVKESIMINGKKYKPIKESKKNPRLFKEIYERTFRSLK